MTKKRRRGDELEEAIYYATYELLQTKGVQEVTFSEVARLAKTSRAVLYRYWDTAFDLMFATVKFFIEQEMSEQQILTFEQGSLRADLIYVGETFLSAATSGASQYFRLLFNLAIDSQNQQQVQAMLKQATESNLQLMDQVVKNAIKQGELKQSPPELTRLALFNQIRYVTLVEGKVPAVTYIEKIVDQLVLPAFIAGN